MVIPASNHKLDKVDAVEATCQNPGNIAYYKCSVCSKLFSDAEGKNEISADDVVIPASSHKYVVGEIVEPTASSAGSIAVNCSVCGVSNSIVLPELIEDNYNNGFYDYRVEYTLQSRGGSTIMAVRKGIYIYNNDDLGIYKEFENPLSSSLSSSGGMADLSSGSYNGVFKATFLKRNLSLDSSSVGIGLKNITDGYYKFTITSPSSDIVATLISSTGVVEDIIVSVDDLSALLKLDSSVTYLIVIHSAADTSSDVEYTIEQAEIPTISDTEECNIGTLQGGNVAGGGQGGSIDVMVSESVAAGSYKLVLYGSTLIGRGSFNIIVNGETLSTTNGMNMVGGRNQISAACTITVNPGDMITIVSMNIQSISNIKVMLVAV